MSSPFTHHPPPWLLHGDIYTFFFYTFPSTASSLPPHTYHPLEASSSYADPSLSKPIGGLSAIQLLRYHDSPVGPYDEMIVIPGYFEYFREDSDGRRRKKRNAKITRIYVSQEETCYNGRLSTSPSPFPPIPITTNPPTYTYNRLERPQTPRNLHLDTAPQLVHLTNRPTPRLPHSLLPHSLHPPILPPTHPLLEQLAQHPRLRHDAGTPASSSGRYAGVSCHAEVEGCEAGDSESGV